MRKLSRFFVETSGAKFGVSLFAEGDLTLAKLEVKVDAMDEVKTCHYGWAFRSPLDKPNRTKGVLVALGKALDEEPLTSKVRHEILNSIPRRVRDYPLSTPPDKSNKLYKKNINSVTRLIITTTKGEFVGGYGCGIRLFYLGEYGVDTCWFDPEANPCNGWRDENTEKKFGTPLTWRPNV